LDGKNPFKDVDPKSAVAPYYWAFYKANIVKGYPDGTLRPAGYLTRGEAAKLIALTLPSEPGQNFIPSRHLLIFSGTGRRSMCLTFTKRE